MATITITYLQSRSPDELRPAAAPALSPRLERAELPCPSLNRFLYTAVGGDWYWHDRLPWTYARWMEYLQRPEVETWIAYVQGTPAGYFELERQNAGRDVEIVYFGLLPEFMGRKLGGWLLTETIRRAWALQPQRVWVHTCTLDGPHALANYLARGLSIYATEHREGGELGPPDGPWPGAKPAPDSPIDTRIGMP
jgi:GNAT superfamily N-acetyltransferase